MVEKQYLMACRFRWGRRFSPCRPGSKPPLPPGGRTAGAGANRNPSAPSAGFHKSDNRGSASYALPAFLTPCSPSAGTVPDFSPGRMKPLLSGPFSAGLSTPYGAQSRLCPPSATIPPLTPLGQRAPEKCETTGRRARSRVLRLMRFVTRPSAQYTSCCRPAPR